MQDIPDKIEKRISKKLYFLYGRQNGEFAFLNLKRILEDFSLGNKIQDARKKFTEQDVILITYGDMIQNDCSPLRTLGSFARTYLKSKINTIHVLPFFKYHSDRGFSIIDHRMTDPKQGDWEDIKELGEDFNLMIDLVINHVSDRHRWFQEFRKGNPEYKDFFIWYAEGNLPLQEDLQKVFRPRVAPLFTEYDTSMGKRYLWTTFPLHQVDLNFKNPQVLLEMIKIMLFYVSKGAGIIRLDAIAFIWKELGTACIHLRQTHMIIQLIRDILDIIAPHVSIITETNVPQKENVEYFGDGRNEAQMVYNFALPPLVIHALYTGDATYISRWAEKLQTPSDDTAFFNFLDSHDGIGILGVKGILPEREIKMMIRRLKEIGGFVSYKVNQKGLESPYEMNATWWSALNAGNEDLETEVRRYCVSRSIALCLKGVPAIYLNGLVGALNDKEAVKKGNNRDINRKNFKKRELITRIEDKTCWMHKVFQVYLDLLEKRNKEPAFYPSSHQKILYLDSSVFALRRTTLDKKESLIALHNLSDQKRPVELKAGSYFDILSEKSYNKAIELQPYQILWLKENG